MDRRISKTKTAIQTAYFNLLKERKQGRITISEITRKANVDRKTFYLHYTSTEDIIREFAETKVNELVERVIAGGTSNNQLVVRVFAVFNEMISEHREMLRFLSDSDAYEYFFAQIKSLLVKRLLQGEDVDHSIYSRTQIEIYVEYFVSGIVSAYVRWIREELPCTMEDLAENVGIVTFGGLQAITGKV